MIVSQTEMFSIRFELTAQLMSCCNCVVQILLIFSQLYTHSFVSKQY